MRERRRAAHPRGRPNLMHLLHDRLPGARASPSRSRTRAPGPRRGRGAACRQPRLNRRSGSGRRSGGSRPSNMSQRVALETTVRPRNTRPSARRTPTARAAAPSPSVIISRTCALPHAGGSAAEQRSAAALAPRGPPPLHAGTRLAGQAGRAEWLKRPQRGAASAPACSCRAFAQHVNIAWPWQA